MEAETTYRITVSEKDTEVLGELIYLKEVMHSYWMIDFNLFILFSAFLCQFYE